MVGADGAGNSAHRVRCRNVDLAKGVSVSMNGDAREGRVSRSRHVARVYVCTQADRDRAEGAGVVNVCAAIGVVKHVEAVIIERNAAERAGDEDFRSAESAIIVTEAVTDVERTANRSAEGRAEFQTVVRGACKGHVQASRRIGFESAAQVAADTGCCRTGESDVAFSGCKARGTDQHSGSKKNLFHSVPSLS